MNVILVSLNSKYIHTNLAIRYLAECIRSEHSVTLQEFTIHDQPIRMAQAIAELKPDIIGFSVYIWNREETFRLIRTVRQMAEKALIVVGGPEVGYGAQSVLEQNPDMDMIITGEGETPWAALLHQLGSGEMRLESVPNLVWRDQGAIRSNRIRTISHDMDRIPFPYRYEENLDPQRIYYYESSRGCPFFCSFCLSSLDRSVRSFSWERVQSDLDWLLSSDLHLVKFVDRTFNFDSARAVKIWRYLIDHWNPDMKFHFEIAADLLNEETINLLKTAPQGYFQLEIGVQSTNPTVLEAVHRSTDISLITQHVHSLRQLDSMHLHLDLIAGLPYEDMDSFIRSFNDVYPLKSHMLQLGFLKVLPGTRIHQQALSWGYRYMPDPPYQVLSNQWVCWQDMSSLIDFEQVFDLFYNCGRFTHTLDYLVPHWDSPFCFYRQAADLYKQKGMLHRGVGIQEQFSFLAHLIDDGDFQGKDYALETLKFDYYCLERPGHIPDWFGEHTVLSGNEKKEIFLAYDSIQSNGEPRDPPKTKKARELAVFDYDCIENRPGRVIYLFDYTQRDYRNRPKYAKIPNEISLDQKKVWKG